MQVEQITRIQSIQRFSSWDNSFFHDSFSPHNLDSVISTVHHAFSYNSCSHSSS